MAGRFTIETEFKGVDRTSSVLSGIEKRTKAMESALSGPVSFADKGIEGFKKVGAVAVVAGAAAGIAFHHMVEAGADFEQSITNVGAVMGKNRGQIKELEEQALSLGVSTQFSSSQVSEAMEQMARKGFDAEEILAGIPGVLNAVAASGEGMAEVSTVVGSSIRGFGLEAKDATHVADLLAFAAEKTGAGILNLGTSLAIAAPTARTLGVSIEDTAAAVGLLQKMGLDASTAGSATATMLAKISHPSTEAAQKMSAMGIAFKDAKGNMLPFRDVLGQFIKAGDKAGGNMDRMSFFAELVGLRGDKAALALSDLAKSGDFDKLAEGLRNTGGYAEKVAKIKMDTTAGSWKLLTSTIEVLEIKLFGLNNGGLKSAIDKTNAWIAANQDLIVSGAAEYADKLVRGVDDLASNIEHGVEVLGFFRDGLEHAFKHSASIAVFGAALDRVFGGKDGEGPGKKAYDLGYGIAYAVDKFILFAAVVKVTQLAVWGLSNVVKIARGVMVAWTAATAAAEWVVTAFGAAQVGTSGLTVAFGGAMTSATIAAGEMAAAEEAATVATGELAIAEEAAAVASAEVAASSGAAATGIAGIGAAASAAALPLAAAAAALAAIYQGYQLVNESGGSSGTWAGVKGLFGVGTKGWGRAGYAEGVDNAMNDQARQEAAQRRGTDASASDISGLKSQTDVLSKSYGVVRANGSYDLTPVARPPGPYADGYVTPTPTVAPQAISSRDDGTSAELISTNKQLQEMVKQLTAKIGGTSGTLKITLPKGAAGELSGAPGVEVNQSGGF